jgi:hypothetical protein
MLAATQIMMSLCLRTNPFTQTTFSSAVLVNGCPGHLAISTEVTRFLNLERHKKYVFFPMSNLKSYLQQYECFCSILPYFKARFGAEMQFIQVCPLKGMPQL